MPQYFLAGNAWLAFALLTYLGRTEMPFRPTMYAFFGRGRELSANEYARFNALLFGAGIVCLLLHVRQRFQEDFKSETP